VILVLQVNQQVVLANGVDLVIPVSIQLQDPLVQLVIKVNIKVIVDDQVVFLVRKGKQQLTLAL
jgi:hypothetical protein